MRIAGWIPKTTNTHTEVCVILFAFPQQQWLHERATMLGYTYIACIVTLYILHDIVTLNIIFPTITLDSGYYSDSDANYTGLLIG